MMKRTLTALLALVLALGLSAAALAETAPAETPALDVATLLTQALQDEGDVRAYYEAAAKAYPQVPAFANLARAEAAHERLLKAAAGKYGVTVDVTPAQTDVPATVEEALALAAKLEQDDIDLYAALLKTPGLPQDLALVFTRLQTASARHLAAVQRAGGRPGQPYGMGGRWNNGDTTPRMPYGQGGRWNNGGTAPQMPYAQGGRWNNGGTAPQMPYGQGGRWNNGGTAPQMPYGQGGRWNNDDTTPRMPYGQGGRWNNGGTMPQMPYGQGGRWNNDGAAPQRPYGQGGRWNNNDTTPRMPFCPAMPWNAVPQNP